MPWKLVLQAPWERAFNKSLNLDALNPTEHVDDYDGADGKDLEKVELKVDANFWKD